MLFEARNVGDVSKVQIVTRTGLLHTLASLSAACCPDIDEVYTDTCARFLACGSAESEVAIVGYDTRCEGVAAPFWMGLDASGMVECRVKMVV